MTVKQNPSLHSVLTENGAHKILMWAMESGIQDMLPIYFILGFDIWRIRIVENYIYVTAKQDTISQKHHSTGHSRTNSEDSGLHSMHFLSTHGMPLTMFKVFMVKLKAENGFQFLFVASLEVNDKRIQEWQTWCNMQSGSVGPVVLPRIDKTGKMLIWLQTSQRHPEKNCSKAEIIPQMMKLLLFSAVGVIHKNGVYKPYLAKWV